jgi:hypothetical protein
MSAAPYVEQPRAIKSGVIYPGALLTFSESEIVTDPVTIYADALFTTPLPNPLQADSAGRWPQIYLDPDAHSEYRAQCISADGLTLIFTDTGIDPAAAPYSRPGPALDASGTPIPLATLTFYYTSTSTLKPIYTSGALDEELPNPVTADEQGVFPDIWMDNTIGYRVLQHTGAGILVYDFQFVSGISPQPPGPPVLSGLNIPEGNQLSWIEATPGSFPVSYYELERSSDGVGSWSVIATVLASAPLSYLDEDVPPSTTFFYRARAFDQASFDSGYSNIVELESAEVDPLWDDVAILLTADTGTLVEWKDPDNSRIYSEVDGTGGISTVRVAFGVASYFNSGTNLQARNFVRVVNPDPTRCVFPGEFTFEGWFNIDAWNTDAFINLFSQPFNFPSAAFVQLGIRKTNKALLYNSFGGTINCSSGVGDVVTANQWVHLAVTRDGADQVRVFLDGVEVSTVAPPYIISGTIGRATGPSESVAPGVGPGESAFDVCRGQALDNSDMHGYFDQIRLTKACRYTSDFTPPTQAFPKLGP